MMNKFSKVVSHTSHKLKQKAGMAEKTVDTPFEECRIILNELLERANAISKAFVKQAEALEALQPTKDLSEDYVLDYQTQDLNTNMGELFRSINNALASMDTKRESLVDLNSYISELKVLKERVGKRDELLINYDKHRSRLANMKSSDKEHAQEEHKTQHYQEAYESANTQLMDDIRIMQSKQSEKLDSSFQLVIKNQMDFFGNMADSYQRTRAVY